MNPTIQLLVGQILLTALKLTASGRYQVFCRMHGHVESISLELYTPDSQWTEDDTQRTQIACAATHWYEPPYEWETELEHAKRQEECKKNLQFMRAALSAYLPETELLLQVAA